MPTHANARTNSTSDLVFATYRQAWLAGLGATAVTRDWVQNDAAPMLRSLVKAGTLAEAQAMRAVESHLESSYAFANATWRTAREQAATAIKEVGAAIPAVLARLPLPVKFVNLARPAVAKFGKPTPAKRFAHKATVKRTVKKAARARKRA